MPLVMGKLRSWKQRYDPKAAFICRRRLRWGGLVYEPGNLIPDELAANKGKLRRFWEAGWIELAEFEAPNVATGQPVRTAVEGPESADLTLPDGASLEQRGSWYVLTMADGTESKVQGREAYHALLEELRGT